jgi:hypothetical protein
LLAVVVLALTAISAPGAEDGLERALAATCRITDGKTSATGFFVALETPTEKGPARTIFLTTAHTFQEMKGNQCTLVLRARQPDTTYVRKETSISIRAEGKPLWKRHAEQDIAALPVDLPNGLAIKPLAAWHLADDKWAADGRIRVGQEVYVPCFPAQLEANPAGWPILRRGSLASYPLRPVTSAKSIIVDFSTFGGDSGAPVVVRGNKGPVVVGMIVGMYRQTNKVSLPFEERIVHTPLGLAMAVQAPFLRETTALVGKTR